ncbi:MAG: vacuolar protein sorting/targeting protein PEP1 [Cirrosporium novae-zelandiae]|nr:MAG: vacuolar protein sorting/targeting protein PEP1 [Cirrosporium novae-zelandiae]
MKSPMGWECQEEEFEALPPAIRKKYFSSLERLRFAQNHASPLISSTCSLSPQINKTTDHSRRRSLSPAGRKLSLNGLPKGPSRRLRNTPSAQGHGEFIHQQATAQWFQQLPEKVQRRHFSSEERLILSGCCETVILDAADEAFYKFGQQSNSSSRALDSCSYHSNEFTIHKSKSESDLLTDSAIDMDESGNDSFRWMEDDDDLDLTLAEYHTAISQTAAHTQQSRPRRHSLRDKIAAASGAFHRYSLSIHRPATQSDHWHSFHPQPHSPTHPPVSFHNRVNTSSISNPSSRHQSRASVSSIDPLAKHYQDPEARLKLRVYLASPQKFDEAIEFGFPSSDMREAFASLPDNRKPENSDGRTFLDDENASIQGDPTFYQEPSPTFQEPPKRSRHHSYHQTSHHRRTSSDFTRHLRSKSTRYPSPVMQVMPGSREMTLRMTLTRPDLRADDDIIFRSPQYGSPRTPRAEDDLLKLEDLPFSGENGPHDVWGPPPKEKGVVKRIWKKMRGSCAKKDGPRIVKTPFENPVSSLFYFDDSDSLLMLDRAAQNVYRSGDAGESWKLVEQDSDTTRPIKGQALDIFQHKYDNKKAYILSDGDTHWKTNDQGKTWKPFQMPAMPLGFRSPFSFHAGNSDKLMFTGAECEGFQCEELTYYTLDNFETIKKLRDDTRGCIWAYSTPLFAEHNSEGLKSIKADRVLCVVKGRYSPWQKDNRLVYSDDYFLEEVEPELEGGRTVQGVVNMAAVKKYIVAAAKADGSDEMALYVSDDTEEWHRAEFPAEHKLVEDAYTVLESTNYSIQLDVMTTKMSNPMGVLFSSNSNGTYFTKNVEHTNRNQQGYVDFEKIQNIQGIVLVNIVDNWKQVEQGSMDRVIKSRISFDDGRTFQPLKAGDKELHLHSVTDLAPSGMGRIFTSTAPGLIMGVGNTGDKLKAYEEGDLYVSDDAGITWKKALDEAHKYEFGDQGSVLVAIYDEGPADKIKYSLDHGKNWEKVDLGEKVHAKLLTTTPDSTSLKFLLLGTSGGGEKAIPYTFFIDFDGLHERKCKEEDFEKWYARLDEDGKPDCLMGHKQYYKRRKADADCFVDEEFKDPEPQFEPCKCTKEDFECDYNFVRGEDRKSCLPAGVMKVPDGTCKDAEDTFKGPSGWRLIPGNECERDGGVSLDQEQVERSCKNALKIPSSGEISNELTIFKANSFREYYYLERSERSKDIDESIVMRLDNQKIYLSKDHGKTWKQILEDRDITSIYPNPYNHDVVYFLTAGEKVFYSLDRGDSIHDFKVPAQQTIERMRPIAFHPDYKDWLIWISATDCDTFSGDECHSTAHLTKDRGDNWQTLLRYVRKCEFIKDPTDGDKQLTYCEQFKDENPNNPLQLVSSTNWFADQTVHFDDIIDFATMSEFIIVAAKDENEKSLKVDASIDGHTFADARFPQNFDVPHQQAYTVLDSSTHAVFLHVTVNNRQDYEYGSIIKSNSNGTSYVMSLNGVNRNTPGYVDFEKMQGLEGVALVNVVKNINEAEKGQAKKLKTMITHNDGAEWALLPAPKKDAVGKDWGCKVKDQPTEDCSLHLHGFTERKSPDDTYSSASAIGLMMGIGNVGPNLALKSDADTFITRDGGITWDSVKKGSYMWEYGDQGSIIVIVKDSEPTDHVYYTLDEGKTWQEYIFSDTQMLIGDITTVPSDNSRNFLLWGKKGSDLATVNLDFSGLADRQCKLDEKHPDSEDGDYYLWEPKHPLQKDNCLFGHVAQYHRKKPEKKCFNGKSIQHLHNIAQNCSCTRQDFECDYNYQLANDGSCQLVPGLAPADHSAICQTDPNAVEYYEPTGYRRIPLSTCSGGRELEYSSQSHPCPGKDEEYNRKRRGGLGIFGIFFIVTICTILGTAAGYWVWNNWDGKFGRIRLGENTAGGHEDWRDSPFVTYPIAAVAGTWAVLKAMPLLGMSLWRTASGWLPVGGDGGGRFGHAGGAYTSRSAFSRGRDGRGGYEGVVADEDELLGAAGLDDEDDEV